MAKLAGHAVVLLSLFVSGAASSLRTAQPAAEKVHGASPIDQVVNLLRDMKAQTEKEAKEDLEAYDKYKCWCETTKAEKEAAIEEAKKHLDELNAFVEEAAAKEGQLKTEIAGLKADIAEDQEALASATKIREEENKAFVAEEADLKETLDLLGQAIAVLAKVQLLQKQKGKVVSAKAEAQALVQVRAIVQSFRMPGRFKNVMVKDLYDMLGAFKGPAGKPVGAFLGQGAHEEPVNTDLPGLPWYKSDEQKGKEANPNDLHGAAAGAKSYNSRSGQILGVLKEMGDEMARDLANAQKEELKAEIDFQKLQAAKLAEIAAATEQKEMKEARLADLLYKVAEAKEDIEKTQKALAADEEFMRELVKNCQIADDEYTDRVKVRSEEIKALGETIEILTGDETRSLFDKTISFVQVGSVSVQHASMQEMAKTRAMQRIVEVARKHKNWQLASLAVRVKLDAFTKVKEAMDKMLAELKAQQKAEVEKRDSCNKELDETEDKIKEAENVKEDLDAKHTELVNTLEKLADQIKTLQAEVAEMEVQLKAAGEQRKSENDLYQTTMSDQRATIQVLHMAQGRLKSFYGFVEIKAHNGQTPFHMAEPPKPKGYEKSASGGGVMQLLAKIIADAESTEAEIKITEQNAQAEYATFVHMTTENIEADRQAIANAEEATAVAEGEKSETEQAQLANEGELKNLNELLGGIHADCDWLLKYYDVRQKARAEEMDAIAEAKAILSGADFGESK